MLMLSFNQNMNETKSCLAYFYKQKEIQQKVVSKNLLATFV